MIWVGLTVLATFISLMLTAIFFPFIEDYVQSIYVSRLDFLGIRSGSNIAGKWSHTWYVSSNEFESSNSSSNSEVLVRQFGRRVFATYDARTSNGKLYTYQLIGKVDKDRYLTGVWRDSRKGNFYHGAFQLAIKVNMETMTGSWIGFSKDGNVKSGAWEWERL